MSPSLFESLKIHDAQLTGQKVQLVPMQIDHADALWEAGDDPQIWQWMGKRIGSHGEMLQFVREALANRDLGIEFPFVVVERASAQIIGGTRYMDIQLHNRNCEIGWTWYAPQFWRTRVNTECKYMLLRHGFEVLDFVRVQLKTDVHNTRSQAAIERLGAVREGILRHHRIQAGGYLRSSVYYSILAAEWPEVKKRLEEWLA
jgi:RimJ/RimL family protein N-acetyltransferase